jgi:hypothetical protein
MTDTCEALIEFCPGSLSNTDEPGTNPAPDRLVIETEPLLFALLGVIDETIIGFTINPPLRIADVDPTPPVLTTTSQYPVVIPVRLKEHVS